MREELMKEEEMLDGFAGFTDNVEGTDQTQGHRVIQGAVIKFNQFSTWVTRDGAELSPNLELVVVDVARIVQKWQNQQPVETIILGPGEKFPDLKERNEKVPQSEWEIGQNGQPQGPWQAQHVVYLLNPENMDRYSFPTGTVGGSIAVRELVDKTLWMRRYRGARVFATIALSDAFMHTKFGGRQRPHFIIKRWISFDGSGQQVLPAEPAKALPPLTVQGTLDAFATPPAQPTTASTQPKTEPKTEPSLGEELDDSIPI